MRWTEGGFFRALTLGYGVVISGGARFTFKRPAQYNKLSEVQACKHMWLRGMLRFARLGDSEWTAIKERDRESRKRCQKLGQAHAVRGRRPVRGVMTVGLRSKGPIKSAEVVESEIEDADDMNVETAWSEVDEIEEWSE